MDIAFAPLASGFGNKLLAEESLGIGQIDLKHMSTGLEIQANGEGIVEIIRSLSGEQIIIFSGYGKTVGDLHPSPVPMANTSFWSSSVGTRFRWI